MKCKFNTLRWYAVGVKPRHEKSASLLLQLKGLQTLVPLTRKLHQYKSRKRAFDLPLFPGYVFCHFDTTACLPVLSTPSVTKILGSGRTPIPIEDSEITSLQIAVREKLSVQSHPYLERGSQVSITEGPLTGLKGIVSDLRSPLRVVLSVSMLRRSVVVEVDTQSLSSSPDFIMQTMPPGVPQELSGGDQTEVEVKAGRRE